MHFKFYDNLKADIENWQDYVTHRVGLKKGDALSFLTRRGIPFEVPREQLPEFHEIFVKRIYTRDFPGAIQLSPKGYIIDVGANHGLFTVFVTQHFPEARIIALEPKPDAFANLRRVLDHAPEYHFTARQTTVALESGWIEVLKDPYAPANTAKIRASCLSLPQLFHEQNIGCCDLLKMKCEGRDYPIIYQLPAKILDRINRLVLEVYPGPEANDTIDGLSFHLLKKGFESRINGVFLTAWREGLG